MFNGVYTIDDDNKINAVFVPVYPESAARNDKIVEGLIRNRTGLDKAIVKRIKKLKQNIDPDYILIEDGAYPSFHSGIYLMVMACALGFLLSRVLSIGTNTKARHYTGLFCRWTLTHRNANREPQRNPH